VQELVASGAASALEMCHIPRTKEHLSMADGTLTVYLAQHPVLQGLATEHIAQIASYARLVQFAPGQRVFQHDTEAEEFYIVKTGKVTVEIPALAGEPLVIQTLGDDSMLGWSWMIPPYMWSFDARASTTTTVVAVDGRRLREACDADPVLGYSLMKRFAALMAERLNAARRAAIKHYSSD
jgi:CRP/FNR family cyclic AMP-dependent transcriptional regulator